MNGVTSKPRHRDVDGGRFDDGAERADAIRERRTLAGVLAAVAVSLVVASALHLTGHVQGRGAPFDAQHAGVAEAVLAAVSVASAGALLSTGRWTRRVAVAGVAVTIAGFLLGLSMTTRGGRWPDIAYHLAILPVLAIALLRLLRMPRQ